MEMIFAVVCRKRVCLTVQGKLSLGDTVAVAADNGTKLRFIDRVDIIFNTIIAQCDISKFTLAVGHFYRGNRRAVVSNLNLYARRVLQ